MKIGREEGRKVSKWMNVYAIAGQRVENVVG